MSLERNEVILRIRKALKARSGKVWSVTGGKGTAWGWIDIDAPPARRTWRHRLKPGTEDRPENYEAYDTGIPGRCSSPEDIAELGKLLKMDVHHQGASIPASSAHYQEYLERAEGKTPGKIAEAYWD